VKKILILDQDVAQEKQATNAIKDGAPIDTVSKSVRNPANEEFGTEPALTICTTTEHLTPLPDPDSPPKEESSPIQVDLSVLGGDDVPSHMRCVSPPHPMAGPVPALITPLSYFFSEYVVVPNWVPISMSAIYLTILATIALAAATGQEFLLRHSRSHDGLI
jgi:hypothetical protein